MPLDLRGFYPDTTPNQALYKIADTIQENTRYNQEKDYRKQKEQEAKNQQNKLFNLREIDQDTDATKFKTGEQRLDDYTQKELAAIKSKALTEYVNLDPVEAEYKLSKDMQGLIGWHTAVKSNIDNTKTGLTDFNKTYPNINAQKAHELAFLELGNDFLEKDKDGNIIRKDPALVKPRNYVSELNTPDKLSEIVEDVTPFAKYIQSFKPQKSGAKEYTSKRGYSVKHGYTAEITPFSEIETDADGKPIGAKLQSEDFKYDGGTLKMIPERQFEQMMEVPQVRASIMGMWGKHKAQFEKETGSKITPANEDKMLRGFLYDEIKSNNLDQHFFKEDNAETIPRVTINNNSGGANAGTSWVTRVQAAMKGGDKQKTTDVFSELIAGDITKFNGVEDLGGGKIKVKILPKQKYDIFGVAIEGATDPVEKIFDVNSRTLPYELQNLYQTIMGGDKKLEQTYFAPNTPTGKDKPTTGYTQITETNKGKIGVKNGKWYYVDTGKPAQ